MVISEPGSRAIRPGAERCNSFCLVGVMVSSEYWSMMMPSAGVSEESVDEMILNRGEPPTDPWGRP